MANCPNCGYDLRPLEEDCPRCRRLAERPLPRPRQPTPATTAATVTAAIYGGVTLWMIALFDRFLAGGTSIGTELAGVSAAALVIGAALGIVVAAESEQRSPAAGVLLAMASVAVVRAAGLSGGGLVGISLQGGVLGGLYGAGFGCIVSGCIRSEKR